LQVDIRDAAAVQNAVHARRIVRGIDICVNNASAINLSTTEAIRYRALRF